ALRAPGRACREVVAARRVRVHRRGPEDQRRQVRQEGPPQAPGGGLARARAGGRSEALAAVLDRVAGPGPGPDAALHDVEDAHGAKALELARRDRAPLPGLADRGYGRFGIQRVGDVLEVVVGRVDRPRDAPATPLALLTDVEYLHPIRVRAVVQLLDGDPLGAFDVAVLRPPAGEAARQVAAEVEDPHCHREPRRPLAVVVVAPHEDDLL